MYHNIVPDCYDEHFKRGAFEDFWGSLMIKHIPKSLNNWRRRRREKQIGFSLKRNTLNILCRQ